MYKYLKQTTFILLVAGLCSQIGFTSEEGKDSKERKSSHSSVPHTKRLQEDQTSAVISPILKSQKTEDEPQIDLSNLGMLCELPYNVRMQLYGLLDSTTRKSLCTQNRALLCEIFQQRGGRIDLKINTPVEALRGMLRKVGKIDLMANCLRYLNVQGLSVLAKQDGKVDETQFLDDEIVDLLARCKNLKSFALSSCIICPGGKNWTEESTENWGNNQNPLRPAARNALTRLCKVISTETLCEELIYDSTPYPKNWKWDHEDCHVNGPFDCDSALEIVCESFNFSKLKKLEIGLNFDTPSLSRIVKEKIEYMTSLEYLNLHFCGDFQELFVELLEKVKNNSKLKVFKLDSEEYSYGFNLNMLTEILNSDLYIQIIYLHNLCFDCDYQNIFRELCQAINQSRSLVELKFLAPTLPYGQGFYNGLNLLFRIKVVCHDCREPIENKCFDPKNLGRKSLIIETYCEECTANGE